MSDDEAVKKNVPSEEEAVNKALARLQRALRNVDEAQERMEKNAGRSTTEGDH